MYSGLICVVVCEEQFTLETEYKIHLLKLMSIYIKMTVSFIYYIIIHY